MLMQCCIRAVVTKHKLGDGGGDLTVGDLFGSGAAAVSAVGSVDPVGNFNAMIRRRDVDLMDKAVAGMEKQVDRWVVRA